MNPPCSKFGGARKPGVGNDDCRNRYRDSLRKQYKNRRRKATTALAATSLASSTVTTTTTTTAPLTHLPPLPPGPEDHVLAVVPPLAAKDLQIRGFAADRLAGVPKDLAAGEAGAEVVEVGAGLRVQAEEPGKFNGFLCVKSWGFVILHRTDLCLTRVR